MKTKSQPKGFWIKKMKKYIQLKFYNIIKIYHHHHHIVFIIILLKITRIFSRIESCSKMNLSYLIYPFFFFFVNRINEYCMSESKTNIHPPTNDRIFVFCFVLILWIPNHIHHLFIVYQMFFFPFFLLVRGIEKEKRWGKRNSEKKVQTN